MQNGTHTVGPVVKYVGHKVSRVRWKPLPSGAIESSDTFVSGSCEDEPNKVCIWQFSEDERPDLVEPQLLCECKIPSNVMDLQFLDEQRVIGSFSNGCVALFRYNSMMKEVIMVHAWEGVHYFKSREPAPCTALGVCRGGGGAVSLVTGGEDGRISVLTADSQKPLRVIDNADNATVTSLACTMQMEVLSTSSSGQLKMWDLRSPSNKPTKTIVITSEYISLDSMDRHPHQPHLVALGRGDGSIGFLDLRQERAVQIVQAHSSEVWDVQFHPTHPNNLFTCAEDGSLWHWDASLSSSSTMSLSQAPRYPSSGSHLASNPSATPSSNVLLSHAAGLSRTPLLAAGLTTGQHPTTTTTAAGFSLVRPPPSTTVADRGTAKETFGRSGFVGTSPWLSGAIQQGKVEIVNLLPDNRLSVNSLDIESRHLICGTDGEALFVVPNLTLT